MKKIFAGIALVMAAVFASGCSCSGGDSNLSLKSYWLESSATDTVSTIDETYTYTVKHEQNLEDNRNPILSVKYNEGATYTVRLQSVSKTNGQSDDALLASLTSVPDGKYYKLSSALSNVGGEYTYTPKKEADAASVVFDGDSVTSVVYFKGTVDALSPVYSTKHIVSTSPMLSGGIAANPSSYVFKTLDYTVTSEYSDVAKITFASNRSTENDASIHTHYLGTAEEVNDYLKPLIGQHKIKKYNKGVFIDNEQLLFIGRALALGNKFSGQIRSIDLSTKLNGTIKVNMGTAQKNATIELGNLDVDYKGEARTKFTCVGLSFALSDGGQIKTAHYATGENDRHVMVKYTSPLSDKLGNLVFTLKSVA